MSRHATELINSTKMNINESKVNETDHLKAYDSINNIGAFNLPKLIFELQNRRIRVIIKNKIP